MAEVKRNHGGGMRCDEVWNGEQPKQRLDQSGLGRRLANREYWVPCTPTLMCKIKHLNPKLSYLYLNRFYRSVILIHVLCLHYFFGMQLPT